ncbi:hypothetical protein KEM54_004261 [Ascosphaera aggregata]|nr:hypothetical protein KEM54_004261 [Ascosphaera aggregata]
MVDEMDSPSIADDMSLPDAPSPQPGDDDMIDEDEHHVVLSRSARQCPTEAEARELAAHGKKSFKCVVTFAVEHKRKYAKEKIKYELAMRDCNELFKEEAQIRDLSKRLREQNDQLLEILADLNNTCHIDAFQRYNLDLPINEGPALDDLYSLPQEITRYHPDIGSSKEVAEDALRRCKEDLHAQRITPAACREVERDILGGGIYRPRRFFSVLRERLKSHLSGYPPRVRPVPDPSDVGFNLGFLSSEQEVAYLEPLDKGHCRLLDGPLSEVEREKEAALRNPMSVFNWFRKDPTWTPPKLVPTPKDGKERDRDYVKEATSKGKERDIESASIISEKVPATNPAPTVASRTPAARASKSRASMQAAALAARQADEYFQDDQDQPVAPSAPTRSKRKRDDDAGYRPKGGSSGRSARRRREDSGRRASRRSANAAVPLEAKRGDADDGVVVVQTAEFDEP